MKDEKTLPGEGGVPKSIHVPEGPVRIEQFLKQRTDRLYFGTGNKETLLRGLRNLINAIRGDEVIMQGIDFREVADVSDFTMTYLTFKFAQKKGKGE